MIVYMDETFRFVALKNSRIGALLSSYKMPIMLVLLFIPQLVQMVTFSLGDITSIYHNYYFVGYETGFGGRKLLGTIFGWFFSGYVGHGKLLPVIWGINAVFIGLLCWLFQECKSGFNGKGNFAIELIVVVWMVSPFSILRYVRDGMSVQYIDIYNMSLTLVFVLLFLYRRGRVSYYLCTLLIALAGILIHHVFLFLFFPLFLSLFIYDCWDGHRVNIVKSLWYGVILLLVVFVVAAIWRFGHMNIGLDSLYSSIVDRTPSGIIKRDGGYALNILYYASQEENIASNAEILPIMYRIHLPVTILVMIPMLLLLWAPFLLAMNSCSGGARWRYFFVWASSAFGTLPVFFIAIDYGRWLYSYFFVQVILLIVLSQLKDSVFARGVGVFGKWLRNHPCLVAMIIIYMASLAASHVFGLPIVSKNN